MFITKKRTRLGVMKTIFYITLRCHNYKCCQFFTSHITTRQKERKKITAKKPCETNKILFHLTFFLCHNTQKMMTKKVTFKSCIEKLPSKNTTLMIFDIKFLIINRFAQLQVYLRQ